VLVKFLGGVLVKFIDANDDGRSAKFAFLDEGRDACDDIHVVIIPASELIYYEHLLLPQDWHVKQPSM